ncbi:MAG: hypothetical protein H7343_11940 [Undibacterium sp.]|nr:hypothetical protein [Opitutaceae bacterium]
MSNFNSDGPSNNDWEDRGDLAWNEFDWERYLREQDESIARYQKLYEACAESPDRIDSVAEQMGWSINDWTEEGGEIPDSEDDEDDDDDDDLDFENGDVYTLHKNPIFIATKAISQGLQQQWIQGAGRTTTLPTPMSLAMLTALHRGEDQAVQAIHALDFGDYAMAISLFKRSLNVLNSTLALLNSDEAGLHPVMVTFREAALPKLFDLREIWLRVINECRDELDRPEESADDED